MLKFQKQGIDKTLTFPCIDEQIVDARDIPAPNPTTLKRVEMASPFAKRSLRLPSLANEEYIGNLVALAATTAIPFKLQVEKEKFNIDFFSQITHYTL